jgi:hypothetical protein
MFCTASATATPPMPRLATKVVTLMPRLDSIARMKMVQTLHCSAQIMSVCATVTWSSSRPLAVDAEIALRRDRDGAVQPQRDLGAEGDEPQVATRSAQAAGRSSTSRPIRIEVASTAMLLVRASVWRSTSTMGFWAASPESSPRRRRNSITAPWMRMKLSTAAPSAKAALVHSMSRVEK